MDDYIRREDAIRLAEQGQVQGFPWQFQMLVRLPSADVVPVVRCRDCKYWDNGNLSFECPWDYGRHGSSDEDDFCSYGERKE